ncbi:hypothetical protein, conserved [Eimeria praecox]|uniref:Transmembrane protein n=1 Tax=Eimeria praecox TaxID=51316 RepID=U6H6U9_9EIME|nr:hypothetical protein, conserved [Eimeria praecox]
MRRRQRAHEHLLVAVGLASLCLCEASDDSFTASHAGGSPVYPWHAAHSQSLQTPSSESILLGFPKALYPRRLFLPVAAYAVASALVFLLFSCFIVFGSIKNTNPRGNQRSLAEEQPRSFCHEHWEFETVLTSPADKRAWEAARKQLTALSLSTTAFQGLKKTERQVVSDARSTLFGHFEQLKTFAKSTSGSPTARATREVERARAALESLAWSPAQDVAALLCKATAYSLGRRMPHAVAEALTAAERVNSPNKPISTTVTREQYQLVEQMVKGMRGDIDNFAFAFQIMYSPALTEVEAAKAALEESESLFPQLSAAGMWDTLDVLERSCRLLRDALGRHTGRRLKRSASLPRTFARLSLGRRPEQAPHAAKDTQAVLHPSPSSSSLYLGEARGADSSASVKKQLGVSPKTTATRRTPLLSGVFQRYRAEKGDSANRKSASAEEVVPKRADASGQERHIGIPEASKLTNSMQEWVVRCRESFQTPLDGAAKDVLLEGIVVEGSTLYREASSVNMDSSIQQALSSAFYDALGDMRKEINKLHRRCIGEWLSTIVQEREKLIRARYALQTSMKELPPDDPPRAGGPYVGDLTVVKAASDAARRALGGLSRFLGVQATHERLSDALEGLKSVLERAEEELQVAIGMAAQAWRRALENDEDGGQRDGEGRISSDTSAAGQSKVALFDSAKSTAQVLQTLAGESVEVQLFIDTLKRQQRSQGSTSSRRSSGRSSGIFRTFSLRRSGSFRGSRSSSTSQKGT